MGVVGLAIPFIFYIVIAFIMKSVGMARNEINQEAIEKKIKSVTPEIALLEIITNAIDA